MTRIERWLAGLTIVGLMAGGAAIWLLWLVATEPVAVLQAISRF